MGRNLIVVLLLLVSPTLTFADQGRSKKWWSTPLIIVLYIGCFLFASAVAVCIRHIRDRHHRVDHHSRATQRGLDAAEIESLPSLRFSEMKLHRLGLGEAGDEQVECAVCLSEFKDQEIIRILPDCFHVFHPHCIAPWLASHITCPTCRSSLEHKQGSSLSRSSIFDGISGPLSQRFDHSGEQSHSHDDNHDHHVMIEIDMFSQSEVNLDGSQQQEALKGSIGRLRRSYSMGDIVVGKPNTKSTSLGTLLPKESSPNSNYHFTTANNNVDNWSSIISSRSDRFVNYSSLVFLEM